MYSRKGRNAPGFFLFFLQNPRTVLDFTARSTISCQPRSSLPGCINTSSASLASLDNFVPETTLLGGICGLISNNKSRRPQRWRSALRMPPPSTLRPHAHFVEVAQQIGGILVDAVGAVSFQFVLAVATGISRQRRPNLRRLLLPNRVLVVNHVTVLIVLARIDKLPHVFGEPGDVGVLQAAHHLELALQVGSVLRRRLGDEQ